MFYSIIPLLIRMGLVHVILTYGTNNTTTDELSRTQIMHRETGSRLVLAARIFYASFIWIAKLTVLEFLKRTIGASWAKSYELGLRLIYAFLALTFVGVVIGTLAECRPFTHYWQVVPDPGPQCREGLVQLIVMGVCDIVTDIVLIVFPIPVVLRSRMPFRKKMSLIALFVVSGILIGITAYRIPSTIDRHADQPYRSLLASLEILAAAFVANVVIIGSFIRDKGVKKAKFRQSLSAASNPRQGITRTRTKSITLQHWGSDEDLVGDMGIALPQMLRSGSNNDAPRAAQAAPPADVEMDLDSIEEEKDVRPTPQQRRRKSSQKLEAMGFGKKSRKRRGSDSSASSSSTDVKLRDLKNRLDDDDGPDAEPEPLSKQMSFFDVGGLVDRPNGGTPTPSGTSRDASQRDLPTAAQQRGRSGSKAFLSDIGGFLSRHKEEEGETPSLHRQTPRGSQSVRGSQGHLSVGYGAGTATSRSLTPVQNTERRKFSRSPGPRGMLERMRRESGSRSVSRNHSRMREGQSSLKEVLQQDQVTPTASPKMKPRDGDGGFEGMSFGDVGGLLR